MQKKCSTYFASANEYFIRWIGYSSLLLPLLQGEDFLLVVSEKQTCKFILSSAS